MCKFCKTEPGDNRTHCLTKGQMVLVEKGLEVGYYRYTFDNDETYHYIFLLYDLPGGGDKCVVEVPIKYCPFCGRKLH